MNLKWMGAILIMVSCGGYGFFLAAAHKREETLLQSLTGMLDYMECELQYRLTPLPDLCREAAKQGAGELGRVFFRLSEELEHQISPDVKRCMDAALAEYGAIPENVREILKLLGKSLGRFDVEGQIRGMEAVRDRCGKRLRKLERNRDVNLRSYQTLGLCAGAALVILFI